jgi:hypothetical protein
MPPGAILEGTKQKLDIPQILNDFYGGPLLQRLTFVVMLREPLSRFQSNFYFFVDLGNFSNAKPCGQLQAGDLRSAYLQGYTFTDCVRESLASATNTSHVVYHDALWGSMYATQLASYLEVLPTSRFALSPMKTYFKDPGTFLEEVAQRVGGVRPDIQVDEASHRRQSIHPTLDADIDHDLRVSYDRFMLPENSKLVSLLIKMHDEGAYVHGFPDGNIDERRIGSWLSAEW